MLQIEYAFTMWRSGEYDEDLAKSTSGQFSSLNYYKTTQEFAQSVAQLEDEEWEIILHAVGTRVEAVRTRETIVIDDSSNFRANLYTDPKSVNKEELIAID